MAILTLIWAALAYFVTPLEDGPKYGLDSKFSISSDKFLSNIVGTTGVRFVKHNCVSILNNGDEFYPAMLEAVGQARYSITIEAYEVGALQQRPPLWNIVGTWCRDL